MEPQDPWSAWQIVITNGVELQYVEQGTGDPVILIHGGGATDARTWGAQLAPFAARYHVIAYSQRYHYPNAAVAGYPDLNSTQAHVDDLYGLIQALQLAPAHLATNSYGGNIALLLALQHPEVVRSLALSEPALLHWLHELPDGPALYADHARAAEPRQLAAQRGDLEEAARLFADVVLGAGLFDALPSAIRQRVLDNARLLSVAATPPPELAPFSREEARTLQLPTLLLTGDHSPRMFLLVADELARCMPHAERAGISNAAHLLHGMNPAAYNEIILAYLARQ